MNRSLLILMLFVFLETGCTVEPNNNQNTPRVSATPPPSTSPAASPSGSPSPSPAAKAEMLPGPNAVPTDTRVVVNIPAYRMDLFEEGQLVKTYQVGIGTPEFPLPTGLRKAESVIFNPTWTVPTKLAPG